MWSLSHQIQHDEEYILKWHHKQLLKTYEITQCSTDSSIELTHMHTNVKNARNGDKSERLNFTYTFKNTSENKSPWTCYAPSTQPLCHSIDSLLQKLPYYVTW